MNLITLLKVQAKYDHNNSSSTWGRFLHRDNLSLGNHLTASICTRLNSVISLHETPFLPFHGGLSHRFFRNYFRNFFRKIIEYFTKSPLLHPTFGTRSNTFSSDFFGNHNTFPNDFSITAQLFAGKTRPKTQLFATHFKEGYNLYPTFAAPSNHPAFPDSCSVIRTFR